MRWLQRIGCLVIVAAISAPAHAEEAPRDPAAAEALFIDARKAFDAGHFAEACQKFAESQRLDPAVGTLINLAACREKTAELALAWTAWTEALRSLRQDDERRPEVARRMHAIESRVPHLTIEGGEKLPPGSRVFRDGVELGLAALGTTMPVDPGKHSVRVEAPDHEPATFDVELKESETKKLTVAVGPAIAKTAPPAESKPKVAPIRPAPAQPLASNPPTPTERTIGFVVGGVGVASLLVSGVTGYLALDRKHTMQDNCVEQGGTQRCNPTGLDAADSGKTLSTLSTITFAAGVALVGVGTYLVISSSDRGSTAVGGSVLPNGGGFRVVRSF